MFLVEEKPAPRAIWGLQSCFSAAHSSADAPMPCMTEEQGEERARPKIPPRSPMWLLGDHAYTLQSVDQMRYNAPLNSTDDKSHPAT
jgi:hypothetical protein